MVEAKKRILSIDALRGLDMIWLVGCATFFTVLAKAWPNAFTKMMAVQVTHVDRGLHLHDLIFPTFVFLAGCSWPFSLASQLNKGATKGQVLGKILKRLAILIVLGAVLFGLPSFDFAHVRFNSILGRVGFGWAGAAIALLYAPRKWWIWGVAVFVLYWAGFLIVPHVINPSANPWTWGPHNVISAFDAWIGKPQPDKWGGEGFYTAIGCIPTAFLGMWAGLVLKRADLTPSNKTLVLLATALILGVFGMLAWAFCPCMKPMWNPTFILVSGAIATGVLALFHWIIDVKGWTTWSLPFRVVGMNAITIYVLSSFVSFTYIAHRLLCGVETFFPEVWTPVIDKGGHLVLMWWFLFFLYKKNVFIRV